MRFLPTAEQQAFIRSLDSLLSAAGAPAAARAWSAGDRAPGAALWARLAGAGVFALAAPEAYGGVGPLPVELALSFVELGRHAMPGPVVETVAVAALLGRLGQQGETEAAKRLLPRLVSGEEIATLAVAGNGPYALDPDAASVLLAVDGASVLRAAPGHGPLRVSADPVRRLGVPMTGGEVLADGPRVARAAAYAADVAMLVTAAQSLGTGLALLERTVAYVRQRTQFGVAVGSFQAVKHRLADTLTGLEFARPLLHGAALSMHPADIAAAKAAAGEAAYAAALTALHLHGAIGYTDEPELALWLRKARPLRDAWGSPAVCRARVLSG
ncbi:acyl-CoA dehydrogenase family protein [Streptomyces sp. NPDC015127]|uniref:acyl-CoA dehydrogenase family protein n=1 Tax=Streptomyces sp. NPDC015127 TaxID=3364939 RepID=UPI0036FF689C